MEYKIGDELFLSDKKGGIVLRVVPHMEERTNADHIRAMNNEELSRIIMCPYDKGDNKDCEMTCTQCCHDWLSQPAKED